LALVVAGALVLVDLIVVPSLERNLISSKLQRLREAAPAIGSQLLNSPSFTLDDTIQEASDSADARVVYFRVLTYSPPKLTVYADSNPVTSADVEDDPLVPEAFAAYPLPVSGTVRYGGERYAEVAYPVFGGPVVLLQAPLRDSLQSIQLVRRRLV